MTHLCKLEWNYPAILVLNFHIALIEQYHNEYFSKLFFVRFVSKYEKHL